MLWLPAPQARSRTRIPDRTPAMSISISVPPERPAENACSHFAHPGAADSHVLRSWDFDVLPAMKQAPDLSDRRVIIAQIRWFKFCYWPQAAVGGFLRFCRC